MHKLTMHKKIRNFLKKVLTNRRRLAIIKTSKREKLKNGVLVPKVVFMKKIPRGFRNKMDEKFMIQIDASHCTSLVEGFCSFRFCGE